MSKSALKRKRELARKRGLKRGKGRLRSEARLERRTAMKKSNRRREARLHQEQFGSDERKEWMWGMVCAACKSGWGKPHIHHVKTRGAGGKAADTVPLCPKCHRLVHDMGRRYVEALYSIDLLSIAKEMERRWQELQEGEG